MEDSRQSSVLYICNMSVLCGTNTQFSYRYIDMTGVTIVEREKNFHDKLCYVMDLLKQACVKGIYDFGVEGIHRKLCYGKR